MAEIVLQTPLHVVLFPVQLKHPCFRSAAASSLSGHKKTKQQIDTLYQSTVSDLVPAARLERVRSFLQGILSPWCLPFHHAGIFSLFNVTPTGKRVKKNRFPVGLCIAGSEAHVRFIVSLSAGTACSVFTDSAYPSTKSSK